MRQSRLSRRNLLKTGVAAGVGSLVAKVPALPRHRPSQPPRPVAISSGNGLPATAKAVELMSAGFDTVEAAVEGVVLVELDPNDMSVGYGGLPNERGVVELDSCVMHGPTMRAGAVASIRNIKTPSRVAKAVMERTDHVLLVADGALEFARAIGFPEEDLLTDRAREAWMRWKSRLSKEDDWLDDAEIAADFPGFKGIDGKVKRPTGTITCLCVNERGEVGGCTSTSGLAFKIPGRVGDSPIIGAGLYVDGEVGACGSTGRGEANIQLCGSRTVVENIKNGMEPLEAILDVLKRLCDQTKSPRLLEKPGRPNFTLQFYALRKDGAFAAANLYKGGTYAVHDGIKNELRELAYLYEKA